MPTNKTRISVTLGNEDYQWISEKAELAGNTKAGIIRQLVRAVRLGRPRLLDFGDDSRMVFADEEIGEEGILALEDYEEESEDAETSEDRSSDEPEADETDEAGGLESFKTQ